jgi:hypothetical protein
MASLANLSEVGQAGHLAIAKLHLIDLLPGSRPNLILRPAVYRPALQNLEAHRAVRLNQEPPLTPVQFAEYTF